MVEELEVARVKWNKILLTGVPMLRPSPEPLEWEHCAHADSKTLDYQRTNPRGYQIVRTHTKETTVIQDPASPNHQ